MRPPRWGAAAPLQDKPGKAHRLEDDLHLAGTCEAFEPVASAASRRVQQVPSRFRPKSGSLMLQFLATNSRIGAWFGYPSASNLKKPPLHPSIRKAARTNATSLQARDSATAVLSWAGHHHVLVVRRALVGACCLGAVLRSAAELPAADFWLRDSEAGVVVVAPLAEQSTSTSNFLVLAAPTSYDGLAGVGSGTFQFINPAVPWNPDGNTLPFDVPSAYVRAVPDPGSYRFAWLAGGEIGDIQKRMPATSDT